MSAHSEIVTLLDWPGEPGRGRAFCPHHEGDGAPHTPSLSVGVRRDGTGALLYCQAGCGTADVLAALDLPAAALFDSWWSRSRVRTGWASWA